MANHKWGLARAAALTRDAGRCQSCGALTELEVHHVVARNGQGYGRGCWNHLDNLVTLCRVCHVVVPRRRHDAQGRLL